jgi:hypothetical protein
LHLAFDDGAGTSEQSADRLYSSAIFVTCRQNEQQILNLLDPENT